MKLFLLPAAVAASSISLNTDLSVMQDTLRSIAQKASNTSAPIPQSTIAIIEDMLQKIEGAVGEALTDDHTAAQKEMDDALDAVNRCARNRNTTFAGDVASATAARKTADSDFHACKVGESGADSLLQKRQIPNSDNYDPATDVSSPNHGHETHETHDFGYDSTRQWHSNSTNYTNKASGRVYSDTGAGAHHTSHEVHAHSEEFEKCSALNATVRTFTNKVKPQDDDAICQPPRPEWEGDGEGYFNFYKRIETSQVWFREMDQFDTTETANYLDQRYECHLARERHIARRVECSRLQSAFEVAACAEANIIDETCHFYNGCYTTMDAEWEAIKAQVEKKEAQMKRQQHALEILRCYGNEMKAGQTDLSRCDDESAACQNCEPLCIDYTPPHPEIPCNEDLQTYRPCGEHWWNTNYGTYVGSDTPVCDCVACADPTLVAFDKANH